MNTGPLVKSMGALKRGVSGEPVGLQAPSIKGTVSFPKAWKFVNPNRQEEKRKGEFSKI